MSSDRQPTEQEKRRYEKATDEFLDLLARLIAREHLRHGADEQVTDDDQQMDGNAGDSK